MSDLSKLLQIAIWVRESLINSLSEQLHLVVADDQGG